MIDDNQLVKTLLDREVLDRETLKQGLSQTKETGNSLYETLISKDFVEEARLVSVVSDVLNVPVHELSGDEIPQDVRDLIPGSMAVRNRVVPVAIDGDELVLGMIDPIDVLAMDEIASHTGIDIRPVLIGPTAIRTLLAELYAPKSAGDSDDAMAAFDDFDVGEMMDEVMAGEDWDDFFPAEESDAVSIEDSAVLSREMRDRPSTDVLAAEDVEPDEEDLPEIEILEELDAPVPKESNKPSAVDLGKWEIDEAISSRRESGSSPIVTASSGAIFGTSFTTDDDEDDDVEELDDDDDTKRGEPEPEPEPESESDVLADTQSSHTTVGLGVDHLKDGTLGGESRTTDDGRELEDTGRTALGVGPSTPETDDDVPAAKAPPADAGASGEENTDYGALGRAILKSKPPEDEATTPPDDSAPEEETDDGASDANDSPANPDSDAADGADETPDQSSAPSEEEPEDEEAPTPDAGPPDEEERVEEASDEEASDEEQRDEAEPVAEEDQSADTSEAPPSLDALESGSSLLPDASSDASVTPQSSDAESDELVADSAGSVELAETSQPAALGETSSSAGIDSEAESTDDSVSEDEVPADVAAEEPEHDRRPTDPEPNILEELEAELDAISAREKESQPQPGSVPFASDEQERPTPSHGFQKVPRPGGGKKKNPFLRQTAGSRKTRVASAPVSLPADVDAESLALALANLLVSKGILTNAEIMEYARRMSKRDN